MLPSAFVCLFVGQITQKTTGHVSTKPGGRMWYVSGKNLLHSAADLDQGQVQESLFHFLLQCGKFGPDPNENQDLIMI